MDRLVRTSRFLSRVLRHAPGDAGIVLDAQGWADVDALIEGARMRGMPLTRALLDDVVARNDKQRFAFDAEGRRIRAHQGYSVPVDLGLTPEPPPRTLYHGTATRHVASIRRTGLQPRTRRHVHLSATPELARQVGARHGRPVVLVVDADGLHRAGHAFYRAANGAWLTDHVPAGFIRAASNRQAGA